MIDFSNDYIFSEEQERFVPANREEIFGIRKIQKQCHGTRVALPSTLMQFLNIDRFNRSVYLKDDTLYKEQQPGCIKKTILIPTMNNVGFLYIPAKLINSYPSATHIKFTEIKETGNVKMTMLQDTTYEEV